MTPWEPTFAEEKVNVYYLDNDPAAAASAHCDRHVRKMIPVVAALLSDVWHSLAPGSLESDIGSTDPGFPRTDFELMKAAGLPFGVVPYIGNQIIYGPLADYHELAEWARETDGNYDWLWQLGQHLLAEHKMRFKRPHPARYVLYALELPPRACPSGAQNEPPTSIPDDHLVMADWFVDAVASYRKFYRDGKRPVLTYTKRPPPEWLRDVATFKE